MCGGVVEDVVSSVDQALVGLDKTVGEAIPGGWTTVGAAALAAATMGGSLAASGALEAGAVATADATAAGLGYSSAAEAIAAGATTATELGLPAATTAADLAAVQGSASAGWASSAGAGVDLGAMGSNTALQSDLASLSNTSAGDALAQATENSTGTGLTSGTGGIGLTGAGGGTGIGIVAPATATGLTDAAGAAIMAPGASSAASTLAGGGGLTLADIVSGAKTGAQIIGNVGNIAGGVGKILGGSQALQQGRQVQPGQADPFSAYRPQFAAQLQALMANPNSITQTPGYQFNLSQGLQGLQAQQAAQGRLVSGGALLQGQQFGQNLAQQTYSDQLKTLMSLSGANQSPATGATGMQSVGASNLASTLGGWQSIAGGFGQVSNPLATLYANFNNPSPNPSV